LTLSDYIGNRINSDKVIDTNHGSGISVSGAWEKLKNWKLSFYFYRFSHNLVSLLW